MDSKLIELVNISKSYSKITALEQVNMFVDQPEIVGLIGDNGAGKSTLIKVISGVHIPDSGEIWVRGQKAAKWSARPELKPSIRTGRWSSSRQLRGTFSWVGSEPDDSAHSN